MKRALCVAFAVVAAVASLQAVRADVTTVVLSQETQKDFAVNAEDKATQSATLTFDIGPAPTPNAKVKECVLRVVPVPLASSLTRADQDVSVLSGAEQVGGWSAYGNTPEPYFAKLREKACLPGQSAVFTLRTDSRYTAWTYYAAGAARSADRPRLIVTYDSPDLARSAETTAWTYKQPASFFSSEWYKLSSGALLANPVSYGRALYLVAGSSNATRLYRLGGAGQFADSPLELPVAAKSFAFVTVQGRLQIITKDAIRSCDLTTLQDKKTASCKEAKDIGALTVNEKETPAMGADGSLYFKNVQAGGSIVGGSIVAFNPSLKEIWATQLKSTAVSPIALSANGRYAYVLANISGTRSLLRIDTTTGDVASHEFIHCPSGSPPCEHSALQTLLRPVAVTKVNGGDSIDYVFVAGNTSDKGYLQLLAFGTHAAKPRVIWSQQLGKTLSTAPALGVDDDSLYVASGGTISRYTWYGSNRLLGSFASPPPTESQIVGANVSGLMLDQGGSLYLYTDKGLYTYLTSEKRLSEPQGLGSAPTVLQFTPNGTLIGYTDKAVYDFSPKAPSPLIVSAFDKETIFSADSVTVAAGAVAKAGERITVKGKSVTFQNGFHWPVGATLYVQSVR
ncbi:MAG: hypothetical protein ACREQZ_06520 [Woeseiaceae bacterium]